MDLWKVATVLPLRIHRSGVLLQGKCTALIASLFAELSQSPHKCNGGRIKFSAKRSATSINYSRISPLSDDWKDDISSTKSLNLAIGTLSGSNVLLLASVVGSCFWLKQRGPGEELQSWNRGGHLGSAPWTTTLLCPTQSAAAHSKLPVNVLTGQCFKRFSLVILKLS